MIGSALIIKRLSPIHTTRSKLHSHNHCDREEENEQENPAREKV